MTLSTLKLMRPWYASISACTILFAVFFLTGFNLFAQNIGDFRSKQNGNWNSNSTWEIYNGTIWVNAGSTVFPGSTANSSAQVTIQPCHTITNTTASSYTLGEITVEGILILQATLILETTPLLWIDGGSIRWTSVNTDLKLPNNSGLMITGPLKTCSPPNTYDLGLSAQPCNNNQALYIGPVKYTSCAGTGNTAFGTFADVNGAGGSIMPAPGASPMAICEGSDQQIQLFGNAIQYHTSITNIQYSWSFVSGPQTIIIPNNVRNYTLPILTLPGDYKFKLTVTASSNKGTIDFDKDIIVSVGQTSEFYHGEWSHGIPSLENHRTAVIKDNYDTSLYGGFEACSCEIQSGANLTIAEDTAVRLLGAITNSGNVIIKNNGNLIQRDDVVNTGSIKVEKFVSHINNVQPTMDYVFWSSPVSGQKLRGVDGFSPGTPSNRFYQYRESDDKFVSTPDVDFLASKGYAIRAEDGLANGYSKTYEFLGVPQNGTINSYLLIKSTNGGGYNMVGNPYPSDIDADLFINENIGNIEGTLYFWTNNIPEQYQMGSQYSGDNYAKYNKTGGLDGAKYNSENPNPIIDKPNGVIKVGQGFIVQALPGKNGQPLVFNNAMRIAETGTFFQKKSKDRFWLELQTDGNIQVSTLVGYFEEATNGFDSAYDAPFSGASDDIYTINNGKWAIQGKALPFETSEVIPVGIKVYENGTHQISLGIAEGLFSAQAIYLLDKQENILHDLQNGPYSFTSMKGEFNNRFEILFQPITIASPTEDSEPQGNKFSIYKNGNKFFFTSSPDKIQDIEIFNLSGRQIYKKKNVNNNTWSIPTNALENSVLIVHIKTQSNLIHTQQIINN